MGEGGCTKQNLDLIQLQLLPTSTKLLSVNAKHSGVCAAAEPTSDRKQGLFDLHHFS